MIGVNIGVPVPREPLGAETLSCGGEGFGFKSRGIGSPVKSLVLRGSGFGARGFGFRVWV